jgi:splicing factor 3A subunit 1
VVQAVHMPDKSDGKLVGQSTHMSGLPLDMTIAELKERIAKWLDLPANRQKLTSPAGGPGGPNGSLMKNQFTLAYYNLQNNDTVTVGLVVRGGRR